MVRLSSTKFHAPQTLKEVFSLLDELKGARLVAGGTDLLVDIKEGLLTVSNLISLQKIAGFKKIEKEKNTIRIGTMVTLSDIIFSSLINQHLPVLAETARSMASAQIRSMATVGGNISSAVPSADLPPGLIAADAKIQLECRESSREVPLSDFFSGPRETTCRAGELLTFILIPIPPPNTGISYQKFTLREANALAVASVASRLTLEKGKINSASIVLGAVAPTPVLAARAAEFLCSKDPSEGLFQEAGELAREEGSPISDIRGSAWYRKELIQVLTRRTLSEAFRRAQGHSRYRKQTR